MHQNTSLYKSTKVGLDTTRYSTFIGTILGNTNSFDQNQGCKINQAYQKAVNLIDDLINVMQEKKEISRIGAKNVGDTNQNVLQLWKEYQTQRRNSYQGDNNYVKQEVSEVDLEKLQLLKVIQAQREQNQSLYRKCHNLSNQNLKLRQSQATGLYSRAYNSFPGPVQSVQYQNHPNYGTSSYLMSSRLFSQLQNLKGQNQFLRQQTIKLLQAPRY